MEFSCINTHLNNLIPESDEKKGIISVWGDIGIGKSTLAFIASLAKLARNQKVIYFNTRPEFKIIRFNQLKSLFKKIDPFNFILYNVQSLDNLVKEILMLEFKILQQIRQLGKCNIKLIVIDELSSLIAMEKGTPDLNTTIKINTVLATLNYLLKKYEISALITSRLAFKSESRDPNSKIIEVPALNKTIDYFSPFLIKIERTLKPSERYIILYKHPSYTLRKILCKITDFGFE
ncbi:MAG: hypothetical protein ACTSRZ_14715 [Promethearchaeota archaeon]